MFCNQIVFDGLTTLARRERDLFRSTIDDYTKVIGEVLTGGSVEERAKRQVDVAGHIYASSVARFLELSEIAARTNVSAVNILSGRVSEMFDKFKSLFGGGGAPTTAAGATPSIAAEPNAVVEDVVAIGNAAEAVSSTETGTPRTARSEKAPSKTTTRSEIAHSNKSRRRTSRS